VTRTRKSGDGRVVVVTLTEGVSHSRITAAGAALFSAGTLPRSQTSKSRRSQNVDVSVEQRRGRNVHFELSERDALDA
jgi:hypothetical protein